MEYAGYNFKLSSSDKYGDVSEVIVKASSYKEAEKLAKALLSGSGIKLGELRKVIDCRLQVQVQDITERRMLIEERSANVNISGKVTEIRVDGGKLAA